MNTISLSISLYTVTYSFVFKFPPHRNSGFLYVVGSVINFLIKAETT